MAPQNLEPEIKVWADKIYHGDPKKFARLAGWIRAAKQTYEVVIIARVLERFVPYAPTITGNWWAYLDRVLDVEEGKYHARNAETQSEQYKTETGELAKALLDGIRRRAEGTGATPDKISRRVR